MVVVVVVVVVVVAAGPLGFDPSDEIQRKITDITGGASVIV